MSNDAQSNSPDELSPKQRFELERWARLHGMSVEEFLSNNIAEQQRIFRNHKSKSAHSEGDSDVKRVARG
ncbi:hypothetical protein [Cerasicoccus frondis]|uniref:hypothetical protein n=1 Tax=Cerasicoccus frondis TaxID=490090 RepID=UPI002852D576|nr:hypothetical protein [Cerasicoccus frondis]